MKNMHLFDRDIKPGKPEAKSTNFCLKSTLVSSVIGHDLSH